MPAQGDAAARAWQRVWGARERVRRCEDAGHGAGPSTPSAGACRSISASRYANKESPQKRLQDLRARTSEHKRFDVLTLGAQALRRGEARHSGSVHWVGPLCAPRSASRLAPRGSHTRREDASLLHICRNGRHHLFFRGREAFCFQACGSPCARADSRAGQVRGGVQVLRPPGALLETASRHRDAAVLASGASGASERGRSPAAGGSQPGAGTRRKAVSQMGCRRGSCGCRLSESSV